MTEERQDEAEQKPDACPKEWWRQDRLDGIGWAAVFFWGALVLLAETTGFAADYSWWDGWAVFFTGVGAIVLLQTLFRLMIPAYRSSWVGSLIFGLILLSIGVGDWVDLSWIWAFALFAAGVAILLEVVRRRR